MTGKRTKLNEEDMLEITKPEVVIRQGRKGRPTLYGPRLFQSRFQECFSSLTQLEKLELGKFLGVTNMYFWTLGRGARTTISKLNAEGIINFIAAVHRLYPDRVPSLTMDELMKPQAYRYDGDV